MVQFEKIIGKKWVDISTIYTLITALIALALIAIQQQNNTFNVLYVLISIVAFLIGVCVIILQLVNFNYFINERNKSSHDVIRKINDSINENKSILFPMKCEPSLSGDIWKIIEKEEVKRIKIICYGTNGFGTIIPKLKDASLPIKTDILVCSPNSEYIHRKEDEVAILSTIKNNQSSNIIFTESPIPSTIRACVLYDSNDNPIWASIQTYYYNCDLMTKNRIFDYQSFLTIVAKKDSSSELMTEMDTIIKKEFERLRDFDLIKEGLNECQINSVNYIKKEGKITKKQYCEINKIDRKNARKADKDLKELVEKQILEIMKDAIVEYYILGEKDDRTSQKI